MSAATGGERVRARVRVEGTVQGVGFRPFVYRLAHEEGLAGHVLNDERGVLLEVEGGAGAVERFVVRLRSDAPPLAVIDNVRSELLAATGAHAFRILDSVRSGDADAPVAPDWATCADCLAELTDPGDRRHRYPFINCTNCGPRFTIVRGVPYDRPLTTMAPFAMCASCRREYDDPVDRRFHAQPNACPACGPRLRVLGADGEPLATGDAPDAVAWVAAQLAAGAVAAVKGLGGVHLVCDAGNEAAVSALRTRKHREDKPFALMVAGVTEARALVELDALGEELTSSGHCPIVLAPRRADARVAAAVAPGLPELGVMLPYTPLHHLLLGDFAAARHAHGDGAGREPAALVMTSGNVSDEPIAYRDADAVERLGAIADLFLLHDREIETRTDDSVTRVARIGGDRRALMLRRSRGYVPAHLGLPVPALRPLLACGAEQKNTFCVARGSRAWVGHHVGDLEHVATLEAYRTGIEHFQKLFAVTPEVVVHDLHPGYLSTRYALEREDVELVGVQHHHAHLAACLAEHGLGAEAAAVGAIFDGTGYGLDGTVWGGELLMGGVVSCERAGRLWPVVLPGGTAAIRQPWRMAWAWLAAAASAGGARAGTPVPLPVTLARTVDPARWRAMASIAAAAEVSPVTSSMGRLFDAAGALCGLVGEASYEGQAAVELEAAAWRSGSTDTGGYAIEIIDADDGLVIDPRAAIAQLAADLASGAAVETVAARFHAGLAHATVRALTRVAGARGVGTAVLSGGVFQNRRLLESVSAGCAGAGLRVLVPQRLPVNDGGISYGQAAVAAARVAD